MAQRVGPAAVLAPTLLALALLAGCAAVPPAAPGTDAPPAPAPAPREAGLPRPASTEAIRTTHPDIFVGNVRAQGEVISRLAAEREDPHWWLRDAQALYSSARLSGRIDRLEAARTQVRRVLARQPRQADALLLAARIESALHRFGDARDLLQRADAAGADAAIVATQRAELELALGDAAATTVLAQAPGDTLEALALAANLAVEQGRLAAAEQLFVRAERAYPDTSPYPLAWLHTQHGIALLRDGQTARAREYFAAARARLPQYYLATEHLAETELRLGNAARAAELYRAVVEQTGEPEFHAALAEAEAALGNHRAAKAAATRARVLYARRLQAHPEAYWQHAARFHLQSGEPEQALALARRNLQLRSDPASELLLAESALAAGHRGEACAAWRRAAASALASPERAQAGALREACALPAASAAGH